ncbi:MAG: MBL fold metallo-hydrolase [Bacteroides sp.]|nr:MBL fold metallo-hydrolase [Bacteroides sp.]
MKITIHRRQNQIGGCITEISTLKTRIFIDLGHNLPDHTGIASDNLANKEAIEHLTAGVDAIFYTHYHGDHLELFHLVPDGIPQYIRETAQKVVIRKYQQLTYMAGKEEEYTCNLSKVEKTRSLKAGRTVSINDMKITPYFVSHSAYESFIYLTEVEGKRVLHTGDFRDHGYVGKGLKKILKKIVDRAPIDILIIEGTMLSREGEQVRTENDLQKEALNIMSKYKNIFILCSSTDLERLATFYAANS